MPGRIKVGVDFGTTYTGVASVHTDRPSDLATIKVWPGPHGGSSDKVYAESLPSNVHRHKFITLP